ncbi:hypothetical protein ACFWFQ_28170, partial [Nocardia salmonicida]|uniref:hypothetical protein n=1 Tax=Nocardia salmonicida TaxID=53431 RepID=UPI00365C3595
MTTTVAIAGGVVAQSAAKPKYRWPFRIAPVRVIAPILVFVAVLGLWSLVSHQLLAEESRRDEDAGAGHLGEQVEDRDDDGRGAG